VEQGGHEQGRSAPRAARPKVETTAGWIEGVASDGLCAFRGIPYARPPVGALRFRAPASVEPWRGVRAADAFGPTPPQNASMVGALLGLPATESSEDCLTLNVWTPACDGARRPVLVWIHGGGFLFGAGSQPLYDGARLARRGDAVVITINYRLGALGWLALPGLGDDGALGGNFGLLDQIAALEWVRDNVAAFGGDPRNVTVFGESAGGMSVGTLLGTPAARGLFQRAILQSGAAHNVSSPEIASRVGRRFLETLGAGARDLGALREAPLAALLDAQAKTAAALFGRMAEGLPFQPVVDGTVLPKRPLDAIASGACAGVPILVGTNLDEWKLFGLADTSLAKLDEAGLVERLARVLGATGGDGTGLAARAVEVYRAARSARRESVEARELWFAIEGDRVFRVPAIRLAEAAAEQGSAVHKYLFGHASPALGGALGACHALEVPFVFGGLEEPAVRAFVGEGDAVQALSDAMQDAWLAFARDGRPAAAGLAPWPAYETGRRATMRLERESRLEHAPLEPERSFWDGLL